MFGTAYRRGRPRRLTSQSSRSLALKRHWPPTRAAGKAAILTSRYNVLGVTFSAAVTSRVVSHRSGSALT